MIGLVIRVIVAAFVLMFVGWILPGFEVAGFTGALIAAVVIAVLGYAAEMLLGKKLSPKSKGIIGFLVAALVIYLAGLIIPAYLTVTFVGALLAAIIIGVIDFFVPIKLR